MKKIPYLRMNSFRNAEYREFATSFLEAFPKSFAASVNLTTQRENYENLYEEYDKVFLLNRKLVLTARVQELDRERDVLFIAFKDSVSLHLRIGTEAQKIAAKEFDFMLTPYRKANLLDYEANSGELGKFLIDLEVAPWPANVETLQLTPTVARLNYLNNEFRDTLQERGGILVDRKYFGKIKELRPQMDKIYHGITEVINALYIAEPDPAKKESIGAVIEAIGGRIPAFQRLLASRHKPSAAGKSNAQSNPKSPASSTQ
jgi:hypothetical protein